MACVAPGSGDADLQPLICLRKLFIATVHDAATNGRLAELKRKAGLITRSGAGADLSEILRPEKSCPFLTFVERLARKAEPAKKRDGPLDHSRMSLPAGDPETLSEQRLQTIHDRFGLRPKVKA